MPIPLIIAIIENLPAIFNLGEEGIALFKELESKIGGTKSLQDAHDALGDFIAHQGAPYDAPSLPGP